MLGLLFALQEWVSSSFWNYHVKLSLLLQAWGAQYFIWGVLCWVLWWTMRSQIYTASLKKILLYFFPLSILVSVVEEAIWVLLFPRLPMGKPPMPFWQRLSFHLDAELMDSLVIFWSAFFLFRGVGYYLRFREKERMTQQLQSQLVHAQMRALRMQLNPHFLFNTMNSISSLMRTDVGAADLMLEQLSRLLRITLHRGDAQFIPLSDEMEFIEMYLAMQDRRFQGRVSQQVTVDPGLHDALVPSMILQPIVENAYAHGLTRLRAHGLLFIEADSHGPVLRLAVTNNGVGLLPPEESNGGGVGLSNVRERLLMHYGGDHTFSISQIDDDRVRVVMTLPLRFADSPHEQTTGYGA
ncbi:MAG: histidine kinase [Edaphobacter sp.]|uniref:sensor histidine kinase n=1 Tax=Edaphobacter sp. TaxID=1934404 RepID=UPI0023944958|nr:histidine kinase [Edaphobacter sp.]MDE1175761.1 histidine kinase [Edaphobacter sp.]